MKTTILSALPLAFFLLASPLHPEEQQKQAQTAPEHYEVVVTATRMEIPAREVASSVTIISSEDLARLKKTSVLEVLQEVVGLSTIQSGGLGAAASAFVRGANSEHTLVLLDGVELNEPMNPSRSFDLAHLGLENIERIEILRGPQSPLYGSDALGGVINIITKRGSGKPKITLSSAGGSYRAFDGQAGISGSIEKLHYSFGLQYFTTQGISAASASYPGNSEKDGYNNLSLSGRLGVKIQDGLEIDLIARSIRADADIDNYGGSYGDDPNNAQDYRSFFLRGQVRGLFLKNRWEQKLGISLIDSKRVHENLPDLAHPDESENGFFRGQTLKLDWQNNFFLHPAHTLTFGLEHEREEGDSEYRTENAWGSFTSFFPLQTAALTGLYVQDHLHLADRFFATLGLRFDHHSQAGRALTYRLAPAYIIKATKTRLKASLGTGFKSPSLYQLYAPATIYGPIGNISLKPEKSLGWDAGINQPFFNESVRLGLTYFHNDFENLINFEMGRGYVNIGKAESKGFEADVETRPMGGFIFKASYTRLEARDKINDTSLLRRPKDRLFTRLSYVFLEKWMASLSFDYTGKRDDMDYSLWPARPIALPAYSLLNGTISLNPSSHIELFVRLDNILDERYEMIYGYGTLGFSARLGAKISL